MVLDKAMGAAEKIYGVLDKLNKAQVDAAVKDLVGDLYREFNSAVHPYIFRLSKENLELQDEIRSLKGKLEKHEQQLALRDQMKFERPYYWKVDGEEKDGPFCQLCFDDGQKTIRLQDWGNRDWKCQKCGNLFNEKEDVWVSKDAPKRGV